MSSGVSLLSVSWLGGFSPCAHGHRVFEASGFRSKCSFVRLPGFIAFGSGVGDFETSLAILMRWSHIRFLEQQTSHGFKEGSPFIRS